MKVLPGTISKEQKTLADQKVRKVTRKIALLIAFMGVFVFFFKLLFF